MVVLKCKMCGGDLSIEDDMSICECEFCGTKQTVPKVDDEKKIKLFERANRLRFNCEFDKAAAVYESIISDYSEEAEGYWGLLLCKYGIEYVDDPATGKKIPTCHRSSFDSIMDDDDFELVMENSDSKARSLYREEAKYIEEIRKGIIEVSGKESPYDIFICYKETDENGERTLDSVLAQDVYDELTGRGYRVFFSRISLEDKLGVEYEPYIFAALNSAKIMLAFGTSYDFYNAVWVKNEWSRYLKLMAKDKTKHLIPCFKGIDAYDIPKEFNKLQSQDMGKIGAMQDLIRGIDKLLSPEKDLEKKNENISLSAVTGSVLPYLKRGYMALEDGEWNKAVSFFEQALNIDAENGQAYWGELLAEKKSENVKALADIYCKRISDDVNNHVPEIVGELENEDKYTEWLEKYVSLSLFTDSEIQDLFYSKICILSKKGIVLELKNIYHEQSILKDNKLYIRALNFADATVKDEIERFNQLIQEGILSLIGDIEKKEETVYVEQEKRITEYFSDLETSFSNADNEWSSFKEKHSEWEKNRKAYDEWKTARLSEWRKKRDEFLSEKQQLNDELNELEKMLKDSSGSIFTKDRRKQLLVEQIDDKKRQITQLGSPKSMDSYLLGGPLLEEEPNEQNFINEIKNHIYEIYKKYNSLLFDQNNLSIVYNNNYHEEEQT